MESETNGCNRHKITAYMTFGPGIIAEVFMFFLSPFRQMFDSFKGP
jgi:hypothetical protein